MVRNMDLIREILIQIEAKSTDVLGTIDIEIEGQEHQTIVYHLKLLVEAGLIDAIDVSSFDGAEFLVRRLTWKGHEFLDSVRDDNVWGEVKTVVKEKGSGIPFEVLKDLAVQITSKMFLG